MKSRRRRDAPPLATPGRAAVAAGEHVHVDPDEVHCLENGGLEPFELVCVVPIRGEARRP